MEIEVRGQPARLSLSSQRPSLLLRYDITCHLVTYNSVNAENKLTKVRTDTFYVTSRSSSHTHTHSFVQLYKRMMRGEEAEGLREYYCAPHITVSN